MVGHGESSAGSYLADPTSPIPSLCASIVVTSTLRVNFYLMCNLIQLMVIFILYFDFENVQKSSRKYFDENNNILVHVYCVLPIIYAIIWQYRITPYFKGFCAAREGSSYT